MLRQSSYHKVEGSRRSDIKRRRAEGPPTLSKKSRQSRESAPYRSPGGEEIHRHVCNIHACHTSDFQEKTDAFKNTLESILLAKPFMEKSKNGHTHLYDIVHFMSDFSRNPNRPLDFKAMQKMFQDFVSIIIESEDSPLSEIEKKQLVNAVENNNVSLLHVALSSENLKIVEAVKDLVKKVNKGDPSAWRGHVNQTTLGNYTLLYSAVRSENLQIIKSVIELVREVNRDDPQALKAHVNQINKEGFSVLLTAACIGHPEIFTCLMKQVKDVNANDPQALKDHVNMQSKEGFSLLQTAACSDNINIMKSVIELVEEVNSDDKRALRKHIMAKNNDGYNILHQSMRNVEIAGHVKLFLMRMLEKEIISPADVSSLLNTKNHVGSLPKPRQDLPPRERRIIDGHLHALQRGALDAINRPESLKNILSRISTRIT